MRLANQPVNRTLLKSIVNGNFKSGDISRFFWLFDGVDEYLSLLDESLNPVSVDVDQVRLFVFPVSGGNAGLPAGAPVLTNGVWHQLDYAHSGTISEIGKNGTDYFHGYVADLDLLFEGVSLVEHKLNTDLSNAQLPNMVGGV